MKSFRGFDQLTLDFNPEVPTVIIGVNGVGKSSILDCVAILISRFIDWVKFPRNDNRSITKQTPKRFTAFLIRNDIKENSESLDISLTTDLENFPGVKLRIHHNQDVDREEIDREVYQLREAAKWFRDRLKENPLVNIPIAVYYPVNRAVFNIQLEIIEKSDFNQIEAYREALTGSTIGFSSFFQWFRILEDIENEERRDNYDYRDRNLEAVRQSISSLIPEFSKLRVRRSPLRMTVEKEGEELTINQLSDGEKCLLAMVGDLARRLAIANPGLIDPLQGQGVVLIDEIELHLHPKWQREIIPALTRTFPNCQFIATTHSPQVLSQLKPEGIYILEKTDEGIVAKKPESSYGRDSNRILEDLMDVPERPQDIKDRLLELFRLIDKGDIESARQIRQQLALEIGEDEPEFVSADVLIRRKEILNR